MPASPEYSTSRATMSGAFAGTLSPAGQAAGACASATPIAVIVAAAVATLPVYLATRRISSRRLKAPSTYKWTRLDIGSWFSSYMWASLSAQFYPRRGANGMVWVSVYNWLALDVQDFV